MSQDRDRRYFTALPNLIDEIGLSVWAHRLYCHIKKVAGDSGECFQKTVTLAEHCGMSEGAVSKAKAELERFGLITRKQSGRREVERISIVDIWAENLRRYSGGETSASERSPYEHSSVHLVNTERSPGERHEEDPHEEDPHEENHTHAPRGSDPPEPANVCVPNRGLEANIRNPSHFSRKGNVPARARPSIYQYETILRCAEKDKTVRNPQGFSSVAEKNGRYDYKVRAMLESEKRDAEKRDANTDLHFLCNGLREIGRPDLIDNITGVDRGCVEGEEGTIFTGVIQEFSPREFAIVCGVISRKYPGAEVDQVKTIPQRAATG